MIVRIWHGELKRVGKRCAQATSSRPTHFSTGQASHWNPAAATIGKALVELPDGNVTVAELHWYEAHGIGRKDMKVKRLLD